MLAADPLKHDPPPEGGAKTSVRSDEFFGEGECRNSRPSTNFGTLPLRSQISTLPPGESSTAGKLSSFVPAAARYGLTSFGPIAISGAHFLVSLLALRGMLRADFGIISFLLATVPLALNISGALVGASASRVPSPALAGAALASHLKINLLYSLCVGVAVFVLLRLSEPDATADIVFGVYAGLMTLRWFGRILSYVLRQLAA